MISARTWSAAFPRPPPGRRPARRPIQVVRQIRCWQGSPLQYRELDAGILTMGLHIMMLYNSHLDAIVGIRTTVSLADDVAAAVQRCANARSGLSEAVNELIRAGLTKRQVKSVSSSRRTTGRGSATQHRRRDQKRTARQAASLMLDLTQTSCSLCRRRACRAAPRHGWLAFGTTQQLPSGRLAVAEPGRLPADRDSSTCVPTTTRTCRGIRHVG